MNIDIYGNPDPMSLFADSRSGGYSWLPDDYISHPIWGQFLTRVFPEFSIAIYPDTTIYPDVTLYPGSGGTAVGIPDVPRPRGI